jgi:hypothetical protein
MMSMALNTVPAFAKDELTKMRARFEHDGYLQIDSLTTADDVEKIRSLLQPLFDNFDAMGRHAVDLAGPGDGTSPPRQPEINDALQFAPDLRNTLAFERCSKIAHALLGVPVGCIFDHAIYKPPHNKTATAWHQDAIYVQGSLEPRAVNFWIPLQPATIENGCMWYLPESHKSGMLPHHVIMERPGGESAYSKGKSFAMDTVDETRAVACPVEVGGATVHDPFNAHYAGPNNTDGWRRAWILHFGAYGKLRNKLHPKAVADKLRGLVGH